MKCKSCGKENVQGAKICEQCGSSLVENKTNMKFSLDRIIVIMLITIGVLSVANVSVGIMKSRKEKLSFQGGSGGGMTKVHETFKTAEPTPTPIPEEVIEEETAAPDEIREGEITEPTPTQQPTATKKPKKTAKPQQSQTVVVQAPQPTPQPQPVWTPPPATPTPVWTPPPATPTPATPPPPPPAILGGF